MRNLWLILVPLGLAGCGGSEAPVSPPDAQPASLPVKKATAPPQAEARPAPDQAELTDEEMDEIDEIIDGILEEELQTPR